MKRFLFLILILFSALIPSFSAPPLPTIAANIQPVQEVVYITKTGKKYHKATCRYLKSSKIKVAKTEAKESGYTACKVCKP